MYPTPLRRSASVVRKPSGVAARLISTAPSRVKIGRADSFCGVEIPGPPPKGNEPRTGAINTKMSGTTSAASSDPKADNNEASIRGYAKRLNKYKAGQSPTTLYPERPRSSKPGLSWLGDDEFESTGLAFKLARHHVQHLASRKPMGDSSSGKNANKNVNPGFNPERGDGMTRTWLGPSNNANRNSSRPKKDTARKHQPKQVDSTAGTPKAAKPSVSTGPTTSKPVLKSSPTPQTPVHVDLKSADFTSLFGPSTTLSAAPSTSARATPGDNGSRRVQLASEYHGGDYSNLVSSSLVTSQGDPLVYAERTMARRRELGPNRRNSALGIIRGMIGKSQGSQPTA